MKQIHLRYLHALPFDLPEIPYFLYKNIFDKIDSPINQKTNLKPQHWLEIEEQLKCDS